MPITLGAKPSPDFAQPLELLRDCHRRVEHFLGVLARVADRAGRPLDDEHSRALLTALDYFQSASLRHTEDEELSLFPRLRRSADPRAARAVAHAQNLEGEHRAAQGHHARIETLGRGWLAMGTLPPAEADELRRELESLTALYHGHIAVEDAQLFPLAAELLEPQQIAEIGREMAARRAADPGRPGSRCARRRLAQLSHAAEAAHES